LRAKPLTKILGGNSMLRAFSLRQVGLAAIASLIGLLALRSPAASAPIGLSIDQPDRTVPAGSTAVFTGTITNNTGVGLDAAVDLFLNFNSFDPAVLSFIQVLGVPDFFLPNGSTSPDVTLFDALVDPSATVAGSRTWRM
jgi:hypothetical protein